jgi:hypothetical protein
MKIPDVYRDWRIMFGLALMLLGTGNWVVGWQKTQLYGQLIASGARHRADATAPGFDELEAGAGDVLKPFTTPEREVSYARARMDFYHATFLTGQALVLAGVVLTLVGFIVIIQRDNRHVHRRLRAALGDNAPPPAH